MPDVAALAGRAIKIAEQVAATQEKIVTTQAGIVKQQAISKRTTRIIAAGLVLDLFLSAAFVFLSHQVCATANQARVAQTRLWDHIIAVSQAPPHETPAERAARLAKVAAFRVYIRSQFAPVNCAAL